MPTAPWKAASTLIVAARNLALNRSINESFDYKLLLLKRSAKSGFMAKAFVFPGGIWDPHDSDLKYEAVIGFDYPEYEADALPELYKSREVNKLIPEIYFKITAIRETFEETGVLICQKTEKAIDPCSLKIWRREVFENASKFLNLCLEHSILPDVKNLHEWSCWLTPVDVGPRRFDTMFYICCLEEIPLATVDDSEISEFRVNRFLAYLKFCRVRL